MRGFPPPEGMLVGDFRQSHTYHILCGRRESTELRGGEEVLAPVCAVTGVQPDPGDPGQMIRSIQ